jgi:hypothetical protein
VNGYAVIQNVPAKTSFRHTGGCASEDHVERQAHEVEWLLAGIRRPSLPDDRGGEGMLLLLLWLLCVMRRR